MIHDEPSFRKKLAFISIAITLFLILLIALGEAALRWVAPKSDSVDIGMTLDGSARVFGLKPRHQSLHFGAMVQTNSLGFREKEYPLERRSGVRRIVVLGDSFTFGLGAEFQDIYSKRIEAELNRSGERYEVINFGVPGYNTTLELATWREVAARFAPDLVILGYVLNDTERFGSDGPRQQAEGSIAGVLRALKRASMLYRFVAPKIAGVAGLFNARYGAKQILASFEDQSAGWVESRDALLQIVREARALGAPTLVVVFPMMANSYPLGPAHETVTRFCREHGIEVLDLMSVVLEQEVSDLVVRLDGHPNGRAHGIFAERIYRHLSENYAPLKEELDAFRRTEPSALPVSAPRAAREAPMRSDDPGRR